MTAPDENGDSQNPCMSEFCEMPSTLRALKSPMEKTVSPFWKSPVENRYMPHSGFQSHEKNAAMTNSPSLSGPLGTAIGPEGKKPYAKIPQSAANAENTMT